MTISTAIRMKADIRQYIEYDKRMTSLEEQCAYQRELAKRNIEKLRDLKIYYKIRIRDLNKELEFWRNTIRNCMYDKKLKDSRAEIIIDKVTENLRTYSTKEKIDTNIDEMFYLANILEKNKNDDK